MSGIKVLSRLLVAFSFGGLITGVASAQTNLTFYALTPCRVVDTRNANGPFGGPSMPAASTRTFPTATSSCNVPSTAQVYSFNVTAIPKSGTLQYLTIWAAGQSQPGVSTLNSQNGQILANAAIVSAGTTGATDVYVSDASDVVIDVNGYFAAPNSGFAFYPLTPCRVVDTRGPTGPLGGPIMSAGQTRTFQLPSGACNIPGSAQAYALNITALPTSTLTYLTAWPAGQAQPYTSTLNSLDGRIVANSAIVSAGNGTDVYVSDQSNVAIDINGYFAPVGSGALYLSEITPCRAVDTRNANGTFGGPSLPAGGSRSFPLLSSSCIPPAGSAAQAFSLNVTAIPPGPLTYLTIWPSGQTQPVVSTLNDLEGIPTANAALVPAGSGGAVSLYVSDASNVVLDINGYFAPPGAEYTLTTAVNPSGSGTVNLVPSGGSYGAGTQVGVTATPNSGYQFTGFSGDLSGASPGTLTMPSRNASVTANFTNSESITVESTNSVNCYTGTGCNSSYRWEPSSVSANGWVTSWHDWGTVRGIPNLANSNAYTSYWSGAWATPTLHQTTAGNPLIDVYLQWDAYRGDLFARCTGHGERTSAFRVASIRGFYRRQLESHGGRGSHGVGLPILLGLPLRCG